MLVKGETDTFFLPILVSFHLFLFLSYVSFQSPEQNDDVRGSPEMGPDRAGRDSGAPECDAGQRSGAGIRIRRGIRKTSHCQVRTH